MVNCVREQLFQTIAAAVTDIAWLTECDVVLNSSNVVRYVFRPSYRIFCATLKDNCSLTVYIYI